MLALCELGTQRQMFLNCIILYQYFMLVFNFIMCFLEKNDESFCFKTEMEEGYNGYAKKFLILDLDTPFL